MSFAVMLGSKFWMSSFDVPRRHVDRVPEELESGLVASQDTSCDWARMQTDTNFEVAYEVLRVFVRSNNSV